MVYNLKQFCIHCFLSCCHALSELATPLVKPFLICFPLLLFFSQFSTQASQVFTVNKCVSNVSVFLLFVLVISLVGSSGCHRFHHTDMLEDAVRGTRSNAIR